MKKKDTLHKWFHRKWFCLHFILFFRSRSRPNSGGTPRGYEGRMASFRPTDHEKYKFLLENQNSSPLVSFVDKSRIQSRSPIFNRSEPINQPIQRSYLKDPSEVNNYRI